MFTFTFDVFGQTLIEHEFLRMRNASRDMRPAFREVADQIMSLEEWMFDSEGGIGKNGRWAPLRLSTVQQKQRKGYGTRILVAEGDLRDSVTREGAEYQVLHIFDTWMQLTTDHPAAKFHQSGTKYMRKRRIFDFRSEHKKTMMKPIHARLMGVT